MSTREKLILAGLYLSKYDEPGLRVLGFDSFVEAFNVIGFSLGSKPASVKNYRDEFDPLFSNGRKGWHKRPTRDYCVAVLERYKDLDLPAFARLVESFLVQPVAALEPDDEVHPTSISSSFAQRLITGIAAEQYFSSVRSSIPELSDYECEDTTKSGCGYDFRLRQHSKDADFLAIEVKGLKGKTGSISMTPKEHAMAEHLRSRFLLFIVRNFREAPYHTFVTDPLHTTLSFARTERILIQVTWNASV